MYSKNYKRLGECQILVHPMINKACLCSIYVYDSMATVTLNALVLYMLLATVNYGVGHLVEVKFYDGENF